MQESLCADAASFDLPSWLLTACISEAKNCIDISVTRREISDDKSNNPDNYAILRGNQPCAHGSSLFRTASLGCICFRFTLFLAIISCIFSRL